MSSLIGERGARIQFLRGDFCVFFDFQNREIADFDFTNFLRFCFVFRQKSLRQVDQGQSSSRTSVQVPIVLMPIELIPCSLAIRGA